MAVQLLTATESNPITINIGTVYRLVDSTRGSSCVYAQNTSSEPITLTSGTWNILTGDEFTFSSNGSIPEGFVGLCAVGEFGRSDRPPGNFTIGLGPTGISGNIFGTSTLLIDLSKTTI